MNLSAMTAFPSIFRAPGAATLARAPCLSRADLVWLAQVLSSLLRRPIAAETAAEQVALAEVQRMLKPQNLATEVIRCQDWLDEARTPAGTRVLVVGADDIRLILGHKDGKVLLVAPGEAAVQTLDLADIRPALEAATLLSVVQQEDTPEKYGWKWFLTAFFARKAVIRDALIASLVIQLIALAFPLATQAIVDKVITNQAISTLIALGIGIALFAVFNGATSWLRQKLLLRLANVVDAELSTRVMAHLFRLPLRYFESRATGVLVTRIHGVERVREFASGAFLLLAMDLPFMLIFLALMLNYSLMLSAIVLGFVAFMVALSFAVGPRLRDFANKHFEAGAKVQGFLTERVAANETIKSLQLENLAVHQFSDLNRAQLDAALNTREFSNGYGTIMQVAEQLMNAAVLCAGAYLVMTGEGLTIGMLVAFQMFSQRVSQPLLRLSGMWQELQQVRIAVAQLGDVMSTDTERYGLAPTSAASGEKRGRLAIDRLTFRHAPERPPLFENLTFTAEPGQVILLTGPSGSGKSTLAKLMLGMYTGYEGTIRLEGRDTRSMPVNELRAAFGVVPQETVLFAGTVADNVMSGSLDATFEQAVQACRMAGVHEAIENLPNGYQTVLGERGIGLSGGQRQRIGIARALLRRPTVLLFDEATSGLDEAAAEHIAQTVNALRGKVTMVFIAHCVPKGLTVDLHVDLARGTLARL